MSTSVLASTRSRARRAGRLALEVISLVLTAIATPALAGAGPEIAGCSVFPPDNIWNARVDGLRVDPRSPDYVRSIGEAQPLHPDFGAKTWKGRPIGIPYVVVPGTQPRVAVSFEYATESDPGPYPIPPDAPIEGGPSSTDDRHVLIVDKDNCRLYELYAVYAKPDGTWRAGSGAIFDLRGHTLRPVGWTSADAAGLPILPGLIRYDEVKAGVIPHALRFTAQVTQRNFVWPARHHASSQTRPGIPPMGQRFRLKSSFDVSPFPRSVQVILVALKQYGLILADNGGNWFLSGTPDPRWHDGELRALKRVKGADLEAVDVTGLVMHPDSGQVRRR